MDSGRGKDYMKKWEKPGLAMLNARDTKETRDYPHYFKCKACKQHFKLDDTGYDGQLDFVVNKPCPACNSTDGLIWSNELQSPGKPVYTPIFGLGGSVLPTGS